MAAGKPPARTARALQTVYPQIIRTSTPSETLCTIAAEPSGVRPANTESLPILSPVSSDQAPVIRRASDGLLALAALLALLALAGPASAAKSCGRLVLDDWNDGRVDGTYELHCYDDAIELIPRDVRYYSSAEEDIKRALLAARRGDEAPPNSGGGQVAPPDEPVDEPDTTTTEGSTSNPPPGDGPGPEVAPDVGSESVSSVPIPLLILAGLALLLVAGGSAGYLVRRLQARRMPPPAV